MLYFGKNESPYHGFFLSLVILNIIPIALYLYLKYMFDKFQPFPDVENTYSAMMFGFGVGSLINLSFCLAGLMKEPFQRVVIRVKNLIENIGVLPFKYTIKAYVEDIKEHGIVFWAFFINVGIYVGLAVYGFIKYFEIYTGIL